MSCRDALSQVFALDPTQVCAAILWSPREGQNGGYCCWRGRRSNPLLVHRTVPGAGLAAAGQGSYLTQRWICG